MKCVVNFRVIILIVIITIIALITIITTRYNNVESFETEDVDVVYTWVNSLDPEWLKRKNKYINKYIEKESISKIDDSKYRWTVTNKAHDEISLSIESVRKYLPWVRNIFVVTQRPQTLPKEFIEKFNVKIVFHDQIFKNKSVLPVFSSHAIEANIHHIPGLAEKFIYFNDDMYINRPMKKEDFFYNGKPIYRTLYMLGFYYTYIHDIIPVKPDNIHKFAITNNKKMMRKFSPYSKIKIPIHHATPVTKTIMLDAEYIFKEEWTKTSNNKFRNSDNIVPVYLALNLAHHKGQMSILSYDKTRNILFASYNHSPGDNYDNYHFICVNEVTDDTFNLLKKQITKK
jgi:hypothetical protein